MGARITEEDPGEVVEGKAKLDAAMTVQLPSQGRCYGGLDAVRARPLLTKEIKYMDALLAEPYEKALSALLNAVMIDPPLTAEELTVGDREYLLLWLRQNTYSSRYLADWVCPKCGHEYKAYGFDLSKIPIRELDDSITEPLSVMLPSDQMVVQVYLPKGRHVEEHTDWNLIYEDCARPEGWPDEKFVEGWLADRPAQDRRMVGAVINRCFHGPDYSACAVKCTAKKKDKPCGWEGSIRLPFRREFFSAEQLYAELVDAAIVSSKDREHISG